VIESGHSKATPSRPFANKFQFNAKTGENRITQQSCFRPQKQLSSCRLNEKVSTHDIQAGRTKPENKRASFGAFLLSLDMNTDDQGNNAAWTKSQAYLALSSNHACISTSKQSTQQPQ